MADVFTGIALADSADGFVRVAVNAQPTDEWTEALPPDEMTEADIAEEAEALSIDGETVFETYDEEG